MPIRPIISNFGISILDLRFVLDEIFSLKGFDSLTSLKKKTSSLLKQEIKMQKLPAAN
jgi:hypothetical protein